MPLESDARPRAAALARWGPLGLYGGLAFALYRVTWTAPSEIVIGIGGDSLQMVWLLGWPLHALAHGMNVMLTNHIDYPGGVNLMWTPTPLVPALLVTPILAAWGPVVAYNLLITLSPALSGWAASLAVSRLTPSRLAALLGGLLYGFSPYVIAQGLGHLNLVMAWTPPLTLLLLHELLVRRRWSPLLVGCALGIVEGVQFYTTAELALTTALVAILGVATLFGVAIARRYRVAPAANALARACPPMLLIAAAIAVPGFLLMRYGPHAVSASIQPTDQYVTDLASLIVPDSLVQIAPPSLVALTDTFTGYPVEWNGYLGVGLVALLVITTIVWRRVPLVAWASIVAGIVLLLSLGPHLHVFGTASIPLPWRVLGRLPYLQHVLPSRLMVHFYLMAAILLAFMVERIQRASSGFAPRAAGSVLVAVSLALLMPPLTVGGTVVPIPSFFGSGGEVTRIPQGSVALIAPFSVSTETLPMVWQAEAGYRFRMPEGYAIRPGSDGSARFDPDPSTTSQVLRTIQSSGAAPRHDEALRHRMLCDMAGWDTRTVVVGPMANQGTAVDTLTWVLGRPPDKTGDVFVWWDVRPGCEQGR